MRKPVGSSKIVARSRMQSSPVCEPRGVIFTGCAQALEQVAAANTKIARMTWACMIFSFWGQTTDSFRVERIRKPWSVPDFQFLVAGLDLVVLDDLGPADHFLAHKGIELVAGRAAYL